ncbi:DNA polymerase IV [Chitinispirillales bacterium ANBcel5]|uniref:DNA polymerase IV n=1 Tax=Cellulosispirillum alkaliphilum TaxID=3039283 RepID=UPI002A544B2F|nr:DNA polymerase IV [Chitinispirillales bacterium ANBcel5]
MDKQRVVFHIDMDAFFTSVEQRDNPGLQGKPVIVGARPGERGVVSAASYEARRFGVHSAMAVSEAYRRCPHGIFLKPRMDAYVKASRAIMDILRSFSPLIEQISVDEAFLDMTGSARLFGQPLNAAEKILEKIREQQSLSASIGVAPNKFLAKIASDYKKPNGITVVPFATDKITAWLSTLPVSKIWGVGQKTKERLYELGIVSTGDLQKCPFDYLHKKLGKQGASLYYLCRGVDERNVEPPKKPKSISREHTFSRDCSNREEWKTVLLSLSQDVARQARDSNLKGSTVVLTYRRPDFSRHSKRMPLPCPCDVSRVIYEYGLKLVSQVRDTTLRLIGIGICDFGRDHQLNLFYQDEHIQTLQNAEKAVDNVLKKYGPGCLKRGSENSKKNKL